MHCTQVLHTRGNNAYNNESQRTQTIAGIEKARDLLKVLLLLMVQVQQVQQCPTRITTVYDEIVDIIERGTLFNAIPRDVVDAISFVNPALDQTELTQDNPIANKHLLPRY